MMRINRYIDQRHVIIMAYDTNTTGLIYYLDELISEYRKANLEYELVHYIDFEFIGSESLIDTFIQLALSLESNRMSAISSSTNKMINDFYMLILNAVNDGYAFLKICYALQEELTGSKYYLKKFCKHNLIFEFISFVTKQKTSLKTKNTLKTTTKTL
jgi:hypothetical protein